jgi:hypothetical protein
MNDTVVVGFIRSPEGEAAAAAVEEVRRRAGRPAVKASRWRRSRPATALGG